MLSRCTKSQSLTAGSSTAMEDLNVTSEETVSTSHGNMDDLDLYTVEPDLAEYSHEILVQESVPMEDNAENGLPQESSLLFCSEEDKNVVQKLLAYSVKFRGRPPKFEASEIDSKGHAWYSCNVCDVRYAGRSELLQHMRTHDKERPFFCKECSQRFKQVVHLKAHMRRHTGEKPFQCTVCEKYFRQKAILDQHMRTHTQDKPYKCTEEGCAKEFTQKSSLLNHLISHRKGKLSEMWMRKNPPTIIRHQNLKRNKGYLKPKYPKQNKRFTDIAVDASWDQKAVCDLPQTDPRLNITTFQTNQRVNIDSLQTDKTENISILRTDQTENINTLQTDQRVNIDNLQTENINTLQTDQTVNITSLQVEQIGDSYVQSNKTFNLLLGKRNSEMSPSSALKAGRKSNQHDHSWDRLVELDSSCNISNVVPGNISDKSENFLVLLVDRSRKESRKVPVPSSTNACTDLLGPLEKEKKKKYGAALCPPGKKFPSINPFLKYASLNKTKLKVENPELCEIQLMEVIASRWNRLTAEQKSTYTEKKVEAVLGSIPSTLGVIAPLSIPAESATASYVLKRPPPSDSIRSSYRMRAMISSVVIGCEGRLQASSGSAIQLCKPNTGLLSAASGRTNNRLLGPADAGRTKNTHVDTNMEDQGSITGQCMEFCDITGKDLVELGEQGDDNSGNLDELVRTEMYAIVGGETGASHSEVVEASVNLDTRDAGEPSLLVGEEYGDAVHCDSQDNIEHFYSIYQI